MRFFILQIFIAFLAFPLVVKTQVESPAYDTAYITDMSDKLALRFYGINKFNGFSLRDKSLGQQVDYSPNRNVNLGIGVNYKWFGLGVAVNLPFLNDDNEKYGKTQRIDAQTNIFTRKYLIDFYGHVYKGFYIENPELYLQNWNSDMNYPQRPDIGVYSLGGSMLYVLNNKEYSARAAFMQTEIQKKSAGSFLIGGFLTIFGAVGDSAFIPGQLHETFNPALTFHQIGVVNYGVSFGYSHTFVLWKKFYLSFTLVPGLAITSYQIDYDPPRQVVSGTVLSGRFLGRTAFVYNSARSFGGIMATGDSYTGKLGTDENNEITFEVGLFRFFYGRRFNFPSDKSNKK